MDYNGNAWWEWLITGITLTLGAVLCFVPGAQGLGVSLLVAGGSMLASNIMSAAGVDSKLASIISCSLDIVAGIALCFTPFASFGASMIGSGVLGLTGGFISESLGGSFALGSAIGSIAGGIIGGKIFDSIKFSKIAKQGILIGKMGKFEAEATARGLAYYDGLKGYKFIEKISPKIANQLGWANNYHYIKNVMKHGGKIYNLGGPKTGSYGKELKLLAKYAYEFVINIVS